MTTVVRDSQTTPRPLTTLAREWAQTERALRVRHPADPEKLDRKIAKCEEKIKELRFGLAAATSQLQRYDNLLAHPKLSHALLSREWKGTWQTKRTQARQEKQQLEARIADEKAKIADLTALKMAVAKHKELSAERRERQIYLGRTALQWGLVEAHGVTPENANEATLYRLGAALAKRERSMPPGADVLVMVSAERIYGKRIEGHSVQLGEPQHSRGQTREQLLAAATAPRRSLSDKAPSQEITHEIEREIRR